ncbi:alpha/beta hydrolase [Streptomyces solicathayae]|uniref:Alpha/beta hydrolase n=1 Tax=Streptomyces solicathayae TaxID=3081768 RepID=A0ABZ0LUM6_9ACTN|nr:alpha/beta hydrolase [Streptomyces sp. HUAS YS2]WOX23055.1 alpha/beta hydrolase [Streptomyces sp. HUAS YS2]
MNTNRLRRTLLASLVVAAVAVPVSGAATRAGIPAPAAVVFDAGDTPQARYAANRVAVAEAARTAEAHGDRRRAGRLRALAAADRRLLAFDGHGTGRIVEVFGDLERARRIAVLVPGSDVNLDTYGGRFRRGAAALSAELGPDAAVVAWLGYDTPETVGPEVLTPGRADEAAPELRAFMGLLRSFNPDARMSALCHSYGSVVCGRAARGLDVTDLVLYGSPGTGADTAAGLGTAARVWVGRGADDWIARVPHVDVEVFGTKLGLGPDPSEPSFGARPFAAGDGGHGDYLEAGTVPLRSIARIVKGDVA